jgi:hypothetical protein
MRVAPVDNGVDRKIFLEQAFAIFLEWNFGLEFAEACGI